MSTPGQSSILGSPIIYAKVDYGPTLGFVYRPVNNRRLVTAAGDDTTQPFDQMVLYNKTIPASFQVFLPDLNLWMTKPYGGFDLIFIDSASNAATYPITFVPFGSQTIEGSAGNFVMDTDGGSTIFIPATDKSGWTLIQETPGTGGGGGTPHAPPNSVQFNDAGAFGGNDGFTYDITTALAVSLTNAGSTSVGATATIVAGDGGATSGDGGAISLASGSAPTSGNGGPLAGNAGDGAGTGTGGGCALFAGDGGSTGGVGGSATLGAGDARGGNSAGGFATLRAGDSHGSTDGGSVHINSGEGGATGRGGSMLLTTANGGVTSGNGGAIQLTSGNGSTASSGGGITLATGSGNGVGNGGDITLGLGVGGGSGIVGHVQIQTLANFTTDALALAGGVPVTGLYRNGNEVRVNSAAANESGSIDVVIDGAGVAITTGLKGYLPPAPFAMTINQATLIANAAGSIVVNIWKCTYAQFDAGATHPVVGDKITASAPPTISAATKSQDSTLTGWTTAIAAGDILAFNIDSVATIQRVALSLKYTKA